MIKVAELLLEKENITRFISTSPLKNLGLTFSREDMIRLLGKRPFVGRSDDMDKWLDQHRGSEKSAPPPLETVDGAGAPADGPIPVAASVRIEER